MTWFDFLYSGLLWFAGWFQHSLIFASNSRTSGWHLLQIDLANILKHIFLLKSSMEGLTRKLTGASFLPLLLSES